MVNRKTYLNRLVNLVGTPDIKVITGIRRSGKSELLKAFIKKQQNKNNNIIFIDFNNLDFEILKDYHELHSYVEKKYVKGKQNFLCIDEIQECANFEKAINSFHSSGKYDIYVTGSNAFLLSSDLATYFTGRFIEISIFPFSLKEFALFFKDEKDVDVLFEKYVLMGGMSGSYVYTDKNEQKNYLKSVYKTITERDIVQHYKIKDVAHIQTLCEYLMDNVGNLSSSNRIANTISANTNHVTISSHIEYLCRSFIFYKCSRFDLHGNNYLNTNQKFYLADHAFRTAILGTRNMDWGRVYENIVYIELLRRGYEVYVGKLYQKEIDFVAKKGGERIFIQVSDDISRKQTLDRELDSLLKIKSAEPKILIARTKHPVYSVDGIKIFDIARWLLELDKE